MLKVLMSCLVLSFFSCLSVCIHVCGNSMRLECIFVLFYFCFNIDKEISLNHCNFLTLFVVGFR